MAKSYQKRKTKKITKKQNQRFMFIVMAIMLILLVVSYLTMGLSLTIVLGIGIGVILLIARFLDKIKSKPKQRKVFNIILIIFLILALLVCIAVVGFGIYIIKEAPHFDITQLDKREASIIYDSDGNEITKLGAELRENITYDDLPEVFIDALIATEDSRYFQHNGFDAPRFIKASIGQVTGNVQPMLSDSGTVQPTLHWLRKSLQRLRSCSVQLLQLLQCQAIPAAWLLPAL